MALGGRGATGLGLIVSIAVAFHFLPAGGVILFQNSKLITVKNLPVFARKEEEKPSKLSDIERLKKRDQ